MNIIASSHSLSHLLVLAHVCLGNALWTVRHPSRASAPAPTRSGKGAARARPRTHQTGTEREETHCGYQEECKGWTDGASNSPYSQLPSLNVYKNACKIMAKDLVRTRRYVQKFTQMRTQLQAVGLRIQTLRSNQSMAEAMRGATRVITVFSSSSPRQSIYRLWRP